MPLLPKSIAAWNTDRFEKVLVQEVAALGLDHLPLQQGLTYSSVALDHALEVVLLDAEQQGDRVIAKLGAFYTGIVAGCSCADDPTPTDEVNEYCELVVAFGLSDGVASVSLADSGQR